MPKPENKPIIMVVDDEPMARTLLRLMLARLNCDIMDAEDGHDALEKISRRRPDILLLDIMMPGINGYEVCEALRDDKKTAELPIIMLSAKTDDLSISRGLKAGATKYMTKPVDAKELNRYVRELLSTPAVHNT